MSDQTLADLQQKVQDGSVFTTLQDYLTICLSFLEFVKKTHPTRIVSPSHTNYIFYQYSGNYGYRITRPLNTDLFIESNTVLQIAFERFVAFLTDLKH